MGFSKRRISIKMCFCCGATIARKLFPALLDYISKCGMIIADPAHPHTTLFFFPVLMNVLGANVYRWQSHRYRSLISGIPTQIRTIGQRMFSHAHHLPRSSAHPELHTINAAGSNPSEGSSPAEAGGFPVSCANFRLPFDRPTCLRLS